MAERYPLVMVSGRVREIASGDRLPAVALPAPVLDGRVLTFGFDNGATAIAAGSTVKLRLPWRFQPDSWTLLSLDDTAGAIKVDVWVDTYANDPPTDADSVCGGHEPEIAASATRAEDTDLSDWADRDWAAGSIVVARVDSCTSIKKCSLSIVGTRLE